MTIEYKHNNVIADYYFRQILTELNLIEVKQMLKTINNNCKIK